MAPGNNDPCPCGSGKELNKCCQKKAKYFPPAQPKGKDALPVLQKTVELFPENAEAHNNLGVALKNIGQLDDAVACYRRALKIKPAFAEAHGNLGIALNRLGRLDEAETSYRCVLEIKPDFAQAHYSLANTLRDLGRLDEAEASYRQALRIKPDYTEAHINLGIIINNLGRLDEAEASYRRALKIKPDFAEAHKNLGKTLCDLNRIDQAIVAYQKVLTIDPKNLGMEAAVTLAILYYLNGSIEQCKSMLDISRPINATSGSALKSARAYWSYLNLLLAKHQKPSREILPRVESTIQDPPHALYVVGESHSLSAHGVVIPYHNRKMSCTAEWIEGCKQWHLGNNKPSNYKCKFESIMKRLPYESRILLLIGEVDCRPDEGVIKAWKKSQGMTLEDVVKATVAPYVLYVTKIATKFGHRLIVGGIPAPNLRMNLHLTPESADQLVKLIRLFNAVLKDEALVAGIDFLDLYALTDRGDGVSSGEWHIDSNHLLPSAIIEAFSNYLIASEHLGSQ